MGKTRASREAFLIYFLEISVLPCYTKQAESMSIPTVSISPTLNVCLSEASRQRKSKPVYGGWCLYKYCILSMLKCAWLVEELVVNSIADIF